MKSAARNVRSKGPSPRAAAKARPKLVQAPRRAAVYPPVSPAGHGGRRRRRPWLFSLPSSLPYVFVAERVEPSPASNGAAAAPDVAASNGGVFAPSENPLVVEGPEALEPEPLEPALDVAPGSNGSASAPGDGELGRARQRRFPFAWLIDDDAALEAETTPATLRRGSRGAVVEDLQRRLTAAGFDAGTADGIFGSGTERAVIGYQSARGLAADGIVGPLTWARLLKEGVSGGAGSTPPTTPPVVVPGRVDWSARSVDDRMRYAMTALVGHGFPPNGAAGIVGNLCAESEVIPNRIEGSLAGAPMRAKDFGDAVVDFSAEQIMNRDPSQRVGPKLPGAGLAQWTLPSRRVGLIRHEFKGKRLGAGILFDMDAQLDYLVTELGTTYPTVRALLRRSDVSLEAASDEVVYRFEVPGSVLNRLRSDPQVQAVFTQRRALARRALDAYRA